MLKETIDELMDSLEKTAAFVAKDWFCAYCSSPDSLVYISPDAKERKEWEYGIQYECISCGAINGFDELKDYYLNKDGKS